LLTTKIRKFANHEKTVSYKTKQFAAPTVSLNNSPTNNEVRKKFANRNNEGSINKFKKATPTPNEGKNFSEWLQLKNKKFHYSKARNDYSQKN